MNYDNKKYWINGVPAKSISLNNRAFHFGDGFFTTAKIKNGKVIFLDYHIDRLIQSANRLMFNNLDLNLLYKEILQAVVGHITGVIKIIISRENIEETYGYRCNKHNKSLRIICIYPLSQHYIKWNKYGVHLMISSIRIARNSYFAGIKHLNRLDQVMIATEIYNSKIADEALVLDTEDNIVECCSANIFWRSNYCVFTPALSYSGVNGIVRQLILKLLPSLGYSVQEVMVGINHLKTMDEIFITNSLVPLASVNSINQDTYKDKKLFHVLNSYITSIMQ